VSLDPNLRSRIERLLSTNPVVLFMKGTKDQPRCGFSASAVNALSSLLEDYADIDVLADPEIREGIKAYGDWPTIPQLYVKGELVGGADIIQQMFNSGELHALLGRPAPDRTPPAITITPAAAEAIRNAMGETDDEKLHLSIDGSFHAQFFLKPSSGHEVVASSQGIEVLMDVASAQRAKGLEIDWVENVQGGGLAIRNPNAPAPIRPITVRDLKAALDANAVTVVDVRPPVDRAKAPFPRAKAIDPAVIAELEALPKDTPLAFLCHHGNSSRSAAEHFRQLGFTKVFNVDGGIDAWSREIDPSVPVY
jgi:monothiol glutaredoxin